MSRNHKRTSVVRRLTEELERFLLGELVDERLADVEFTAIGVSQDKKVVTIDYLPPAGSEDVVAAALKGLGRVLESRAAPVLHTTPEVRFRYDRGADNERRVGEILDELRRSGELETDDAPPAEPAEPTWDEID